MSAHDLARTAVQLLPATRGNLRELRLLPGVNATLPGGGTFYLEVERWLDHIRATHVVEAPNARGKRTTTWWPVMHSVSGRATMTDDDVVAVICDAVLKGDWQNAPRGTLLAVYDLPAEQAAAFGVSEVKVSVAPDGRILSAYPARGENVLAVREHTREERAALEAPVAAGPPQLSFAARVPATSFG